MQRRWLLVIGIIVIVVSITAGFVIWKASQEREAVQAAEQAALAAKQELENSRNNFAASPERQIWFTSTIDKTNQVYVGNTVTEQSLGMTSVAPSTISNVTPATKHWYGISGTALTLYAGGATQAIGAIVNVPTKTELAVSGNEQTLAWVTATNKLQSVIVYDLVTRTERVLFTGDADVEYDNLTWSPDGTELALTADHNTIITLDTNGAELNKRISIPFIEWSSLTWITADEFGAVGSSDHLNPEPFEPFVAVINRAGDIIERHQVFDKVGVPKVVWHSSGSAFAFVDPWQNVFRIYNRYDQLVQSINFPVVGRLNPMGLTDGTGVSLTQLVTTPIEDGATNTNSDVNTNTTPTTEPISFEVSAEDWESFNTTVRGILGQWPIDFGSYRFNTNSRGLQIVFQPPVEPSEPLELIVLQVVEQVFAVLPSVPEVSIQVTDVTGQTVIQLKDITRSEASELAKSFTGRDTEQLFVVNKETPYGQRTAKPANKDHHFIGDLVYSTFGDYNPLPALGRLGATLGKQTFYANTNAGYVVGYPTDLSVKAIDDRTVLFYGTNTTFISATAFGAFGITVKESSAPGVSLEQWLSVNRSDSTTEPLGFDLPKPLTGVRLVSKTDHTLEAVLLGNDHAYVVTLTRDAGVTADDQATLDEMLNTFSLTYVFQR